MLLHSESLFQQTSVADKKQGLTSSGQWISLDRLPQPFHRPGERLHPQMHHLVEVTDRLCATGMVLRPPQPSFTRSRPTGLSRNGGRAYLGI